MNQIGKVFFEILSDIKTETFEHRDLLNELEKRLPNLKPITLNRYSRYINQFIPRCISVGILKSEEHFNKVLPVFILLTDIDATQFIIESEPEFEDFSDDYDMYELLSFADKVVMNTAQLMVKVKEAEVLKVILEKSIKQNNYSELRMTYQKI
ncbi:MAG: hypothetical protein PHV54_09210 [Tolumonas sp.]|jgi:hypothetical protein|nr:hypothetical protein [Tolumonas sp.]